MESEQRIVVGTQPCGQFLTGNGLVEHPADADPVDQRGLNPKADNAAGEYIHHHQRPMAAQQNGFAAEHVDAPEAVFWLCKKRQPGRAIGTGDVGWRELGQHPPDDDVLIDLDLRTCGKSAARCARIRILDCAA